MFSSGNQVPGSFVPVLLHTVTKYSSSVTHELLHLQCVLSLDSTQVIFTSLVPDVLLEKAKHGNI